MIDKLRLKMKFFQSKANYLTEPGSTLKCVPRVRVSHVETLCDSEPFTETGEKPNLPISDREFWIPGYACAAMVRAGSAFGFVLVLSRSSQNEVVGSTADNPI